MEITVAKYLLNWKIIVQSINHWRTSLLQWLSIQETSISSPLDWLTQWWWCTGWKSCFTIAVHCFTIAVLWIFFFCILFYSPRHFRWQPRNIFQTNIMEDIFSTTRWLCKAKPVIQLLIASCTSWISFNWIIQEMTGSAICTRRKLHLRRSSQKWVLSKSVSSWVIGSLETNELITDCMVSKDVIRCIFQTAKNNTFDFATLYHDRIKGEMKGITYSRITLGRTFRDEGLGGSRHKVLQGFYLFALSRMRTISHYVHLNTFYHPI